jgi:hypothetical protein
MAYDASTAPKVTAPADQKPTPPRPTPRRPRAAWNITSGRSARLIGTTVVEGWQFFVRAADTPEQALAALGGISRQTVSNLRAQIRELRGELAAVRELTGGRDVREVLTELAARTADAERCESSARAVMSDAIARASKLESEAAGLRIDILALKARLEEAEKPWSLIERIWGRR